MAANRKLQAIGPNDPSPDKKSESTSDKVTTVYEAAKSGSVLAELKALRFVVAKKLDDPNISGRDLASLSKRHIEISREIEAAEKAAAEEADEDVISDEDFDEEAI